jgi:hypothetical protein
LAFNGSGVHNRVHDWTQDLAGTIPVTASRMDAEHDDISAALSNTICRDGQSTTTARIPFASGVSAAAGTTASVAYAQINDPNTGLYFPATDQWGLVAGGTASLTSTATKLTAAVAVDFTGAAAPASDDGAALGSTSQKWSDLFLAPGGVINFNSGDVTVTHSSNALAFAGGAVSFDSQVTVSSGGIAVSAGGASIIGDSSVTGTFSISSTLSAGATSVTTIVASGAVSGATAAGDMVASKAEMEAATATNKLVSPGRQQHHPAHPKAYAILAVPTSITAGYNMSSVSNPITGVYVFNFTTAFSSAEYGVSFTPFHVGSNAVSAVVAGRSASQVTIQVRNAATGVAMALDTGGMLLAYGDQ